jgi:Zn-dependent peptidase ImmA (M78 family)
LELKCKYLTKEEIRSISEKFRNTYWDRETIPVNIEHIIEHGLHLEVIPVHGIRQFEKIDAYLKSDRSGIVVDIEQYMDVQGRYENRLRFSLAHEIGHYMLHGYIYKKFAIDTPQEYIDFVMSLPENEYKSIEWQANEFAGSLLVPRTRLFQEIEIAQERLKLKGLSHLWDSNREQVLVSMSPTIGRVFGVSDDVIERRINEERDLWL